MTDFVADIVPLTKRGAYQGYMSAFGGVAAAVGPILGGVLTEKASWYVRRQSSPSSSKLTVVQGGGVSVSHRHRSALTSDINLPLGGISLAILFFSLKLNPTRKYSITELRRTFDWPGL